MPFSSASALLGAAVTVANARAAEAIDEKNITIRYHSREGILLPRNFYSAVQASANKRTYPSPGSAKYRCPAKLKSYRSFKSGHAFLKLAKPFLPR